MKRYGVFIITLIIICGMFCSCDNNKNLNTDDNVSKVLEDSNILEKKYNESNQTKFNPIQYSIEDNTIIGNFALEYNDYYPDGSYEKIDKKYPIVKVENENYSEIELKINNTIKKLDSNEYGTKLNDIGDMVLY